jgi:DoxX-like family
LFDIIVWIAGGFLAIFFLAAGLPKIIGRGIERWIGFDQVPRGLTILIGFSEVSAAIALVVPLLVDEFRWITPLAAVGVGVISLLASGFHLRNREWLASLETALWASLAVSIAVARWGELSSGPSISRNVLIPLWLALLPGIVVNLVFLTRATAPENLVERPRATTAAS